MRPSAFHGPLPRMKPQPAHIGAMIRKRIVGRDRRLEDTYRIKSWLEDIQQESKFEQNLAAVVANAPFDRVFSDHDEQTASVEKASGRAAKTGKKASKTSKSNAVGEKLQEEWQQALKEELALIEATFDREKERSSRPFPPEMLDLMKRARVEKYHNKKREAEREARGEVLAITLKRRGTGFPVAVREKWSRQRHKEMHIMKRSKAVVGYVGMLKRKYGWKVPPEEDRYEGKDEERLKRREEAIRKVNLIRREGAERREAESSVVIEEGQASETMILKTLDEEEAKASSSSVKTRGRLSLRRWREMLREYVVERRAAISAETQKQPEARKLTTKQWKELARQQLKTEAIDGSA